MRKRFVLIFLLLGNLAHSQELDFTTVDRLSYDYYLRGQWDSLIWIANQGLANNIESYFINLRLGVAYYEKRQYVDAEKYLSKTLDKDPYNDFNLSVLQLVKLNLGDYYHAVRLYREMSNEAKQAAVNLLKPLNTAHCISGVKLSDSKAFNSSTFFASVGVGHALSQKITLYESATYLHSKNKTWGNWQQQQFMVMGSYYTNHGRFDVCAHPYKVGTEIEYNESNQQWGTRSNPYPFIDRVDSTYTTQVFVNGTSETRGLYSQLTYNQRIGGVKWSVFGGFLAEKQTPELYYNYFYGLNLRYFTTDSVMVDNLSFDERYMIDYTQKKVHRRFFTGASIYYSKLWKERVTVGLNLYQPLDSAKTIVSPFAKLHLNRISVYASYFYKGSNFLAEGNGAILNNTADIIHNRVEIKATIKVKPGIILDLSGQWENRTDDFTGKRYSLNSYACGIVVFL